MTVFDMLWLEENVLLPILMFPYSGYDNAKSLILSNFDLI